MPVQSDGHGTPEITPNSCKVTRQLETHPGHQSEPEETVGIGFVDAAQGVFGVAEFAGGNRIEKVAGTGEIQSVPPNLSNGGRLQEQLAASDVLCPFEADLDLADRHALAV